MTIDPRSRDAVIRTIIGEAAGEPPEGWAAVANVIKNRVDSGKWGEGVGNVVFAPRQFSAWNNGNKNGMAVQPGDPIYDRIGSVVDQVFNGQVPDNTGGSTYYYAPAGMGQHGAPDWASQGTNPTQIGNHIFMGMPSVYVPPSGPIQRPISPQGYSMFNYANVGNFGDPASPGWVENNLTTVGGAGQQWQVNKKAADAFQGFLWDLHNEGYTAKSSGGYNYRNIRGGSELSQHAFGNAIDIDAPNNPLGTTQTNLPPNVRELAAKWGLSWGMDMHGRKDPMHFEWTGRAPQAGDAAPTWSQPAQTPQVPEMAPTTGQPLGGPVAQPGGQPSAQNQADLPPPNATPTEGTVPMAKAAGGHPLVSDATIKANKMTPAQIAELESARESAQRIQGKSGKPGDVQQWGNNVPRDSLTLAQQGKGFVPTAPTPAAAPSMLSHVKQSLAKGKGGKGGANVPAKGASPTSGVTAVPLPPPRPGAGADPTAASLVANGPQGMPVPAVQADGPPIPPGLTVPPNAAPGTPADPAARAALQARMRGDVPPMTPEVAAAVSPRPQQGPPISLFQHAAPSQPALPVPNAAPGAAGMDPAAQAALQARMRGDVPGMARGVLGPSPPPFVPSAPAAPAAPAAPPPNPWVAKGLPPLDGPAATAATPPAVAGQPGATGITQPPMSQSSPPPASPVPNAAPGAAGMDPAAQAALRAKMTGQIPGPGGYMTPAVQYGGPIPSQPPPPSASQSWLTRLFGG